MPAKQVVQNECERCPRVWYTDAEEPKVSLAVSMSVNGQVIRGSFDTLCDSCKKACASAVKTLLKSMKKTSPKKVSGNAKHDE